MAKGRLASRSFPPSEDFFGEHVMAGRRDLRVSEVFTKVVLHNMMLPRLAGARWEGIGGHRRSMMQQPC